MSPVSDTPSAASGAAVRLSPLAAAARHAGAARATAPSPPAAPQPAPLDAPVWPTPTSRGRRLLGGPITAPLLGVSYPVMEVARDASAAEVALGRVLLQQRLTMHLAPGLWLQRAVDAAALGAGEGEGAAPVVARLAASNRLCGHLAGVAGYERTAEMAGARLSLAFIDQAASLYLEGGDRWRQIMALCALPIPNPKRALALLGWSAGHAVDLDLSGCRLTDQDVPALQRATCHMTALVVVSLGRNPLTDDAVPALRRWGLSLPRLSFFLLGDTAIGEAAQQGLQEDLTARPQALPLDDTGRLLITQQALHELEVATPLRASLRAGRDGAAIAALLAGEPLSLRRMTHLSLTGIVWRPQELVAAAEVLGSCGQLLQILTLHADGLASAPPAARRHAAQSVLASLAPLGSLSVLALPALPIGREEAVQLYEHLLGWDNLVHFSCCFEADLAGTRGWVADMRRWIAALLDHRDPGQQRLSTQMRRRDTLQQGVHIIASNFVEQLTGEAHPPAPPATFVPWPDGKWVPPLDDAEGLA